MVARVMIGVVKCNFAGERRKQDYPRDLIGYGANPPDAGWSMARGIAVQRA